MNSHGPTIPHVQPAIPLYTGRRQHDMSYPLQVSQPPYAHPFQHAYHHAVPQHFHPQPPLLWYHGMPASIPRPYQQYPPMMNSHYQLPHNPPSISPRPIPSHHMPSPSSIRSSLLSPPPVDRSLHVSPSTIMPRPSPPPAPPPTVRHMPFNPPLPWYSVPDTDFPGKSSRRRKRRPLPQSPSIPVELPLRVDTTAGTNVTEKKTVPDVALPPYSDSISSAPELSGSATPTTSQAPSEADSTQPTTPSSAVPPAVPPRTLSSSTTVSSARPPGKAMTFIPVVPNIPSLSRPSKKKSVSIASETAKPTESVKYSAHPSSDIDTAAPSIGEDVPLASEKSSKASFQAKSAPKSWADLVRTAAQTSFPTAHHSIESSNSQLDSLGVFKAGSLSAALNSFQVDRERSETKIAFLKPRGLVNTGNMCYMNSVLQVLVFCFPFYDLLERVGKQAPHSFKSDTPLVDAMTMFMREFPVIDSAVSSDQLRMRLKDNELEQYGEAFIPEFVYGVIRGLPRFSTMRRGHQQDAEEFLGFLLEEMHDECSRAMKASSSFMTQNDLPLTDDAKSPIGEAGFSEGNGWLEVGPRQRPAITRSSGIVAIESPVTKIFGGKWRSELRVPGAKNSVTLEPYQSLQLDIGSPQVNNIIDALKGLTRSETLHGDFNSPRGPGVAATKQVFIETLPPVLILHLKRFQYDNTGGTQKIWKKVGYPLELEIPREVFPQHKRAGFAAYGGLPKYQLTAVVYHHGKNAGGGHYTVDVRRQDGREWIRLDDTVIRRVRSEDVVEGGSEEDPKVLAAALEQHKKDEGSSSRVFYQVRKEDEEKTQSEAGWSQVNSAVAGSTPKKWLGIENGVATPVSSSGKRTPVSRHSLKDNKVAYLLFYQNVGI